MRKGFLSRFSRFGATEQEMEERQKQRMGATSDHAIRPAGDVPRHVAESAEFMRDSEMWANIRDTLRSKFLDDFQNAETSDDTGLANAKQGLDLLKTIDERINSMADDMKLHRRHEQRAKEHQEMRNINPAPER